MQFAIDLPPFGPFSDPSLVAQLAEVAEKAGWHGFFLWDHLNYRLEGPPRSVIRVRQARQDRPAAGTS